MSTRLTSTQQDAIRYFAATAKVRACWTREPAVSTTRSLIAAGLILERQATDTERAALGIVSDHWRITELTLAGRTARQADADQQLARLRRTDPAYTTTCNCCFAPIRWNEHDETWIDPNGAEGCSDPQQPNAGNFPHEPIDDSAQWKDA